MATVKPILCLMFLISITLAFSQTKVFVFTDINLVGGDPDDRQSWIHLMWYSDELDIVGVVPDRWNGKGVEACKIGLEAYRKDYKRYDFRSKGLASPETLRERVLTSEEEAVLTLNRLVANSEDPIYVLVWGNMNTLKKALFIYPEIADGIRVLSIGTGLKYGPRDEVPGEDCNVPNWNGGGRNEIYNDPRFKDLWWVESNWTYNGMFQGDGPKEMFNKLQEYGAMGSQIKEVTQEHDWAQYFRVGDTPSVTYLLDNDHDPNDPETGSWAGKFKKPFPESRPNYFTDDNGEIEWDYENPCNSWSNLVEMYEYNKSTLVAKRQNMYDNLIKKLDDLYDR